MHRAGTSQNEDVGNSGRRKKIGEHLDSAHQEKKRLKMNIVHHGFLNTASRGGVPGGQGGV
eukprot:m.302620 g.302620  ORF g.302620 m.302620 type:complete len:61 (-) comp23001_c0_seq2:147-329(-)